MKMRKIVAILAAVLMLCSIMPFSAFATEYELANSLNVGDTVVLVYSNGSKELSGISTTSTKYGIGVAYSGSPAAVYALTVEAGASDGTYAFKTIDGKYLTWTSGNSLNVATSISANSSWTVTFDGNNAVIKNAKDSTRQIFWNNSSPRFACYSKSGQQAVQLYKKATGNADCDHDALNCGETCSSCGVVKEHKFSNNCVAECENGCGEVNPNYADHVYSYTYDAECDVCLAKREVDLPAADSVLTIPEAIAIGQGFASNTYTENKYYITGKVVSIENETYGNTTIEDADGNQILIYGTLDENGNKYGEMTEKHEAGMTITVYGIIGQFNSTSQMKNGTITAMEGGCEHQYEYDCSTTCKLCGYGVRDVVCVTNAAYACQDGLCIYCGNDVNAVEHAFDDQWDPDCNYGCGYTREVEEKPDMTEATLDFSTTDQRTEYTTTVQKWENEGLTLVNNKAASTSNVGDYYKPARFYKNSEIVITYTGMTSLVIDATGIGSDYLWDATLAAYKTTVENGIYTITFDEPTDSITLTAAAQVRANSITATAVKQSGGEEPPVEECAHDYVGVETQAPTCTVPGVMTYTCSKCENSYTEAIEVISHNYVDGFCSVCGAEDSIIAEYTITFDEDKTQRTEFSTTKQVWKNGPMTFTNNKASSTSNVADYGAPVRLYASSEIVIECVGMTQIVFDCNNTTYANALKNSIGDTATVSDDKVTVAVSDDTFTISKLTAQVRLDSITVAAKTQSSASCEHKNAYECDAYCPDCGALINEGATHVSDAQYPCYAGTCIHCGDAIEAVDHVLDENDICTICGLAPTPEKPVDPENPQEYVFSEFAAGTQYAEGEKHFLDNAITVITTQTHFTTQLRIYSSSTHDGNVVIKSKKDISAIVLNAGDAVDVLNVYVSEDGEIYEAIAVTKTSYNDYTLLIPEMTKYIKLDVAGTNQVRIAKMTLYFDGEAPHVCNVVEQERVEATCGEDGYVKYACACGEGAYTETLPATGEHTYFDDCSAICETCGYEREVSHNIVHVEAKAATCNANGNIEYWYCDVCGMAWLDADCIMNTNLRAVITPATGEHTYDDEYDADCNVCGDVREVPEKPVDVVYGDANGDGSVNIRDVILLQQFIANWTVTMDEAAADANADGSVNIRDVILLQQFIANWEVTLG